MNKKLIACLSVIGSVCYFGSNLSMKQITSTSTSPNIRSIHDTYVTRRPSSQKPQVIEEEIKPSSFQKTKNKISFKGSSHPALPANYKFAKDVSVVKKNQFDSSMGEVVDEKNGFVFYRSDSHSGEFNHVVIESKSQKLFPVSSVLKLEGVDESLRNDLLSKGFEEHYYHEDLKIMYVQSTQLDLLKSHEELSEYKLNPQIEILRGFHRLK